MTRMVHIKHNDDDDDDDGRGGIDAVDVIAMFKA